MTEGIRGRLTTPNDVNVFTLAGNATLTLVSEKTGTRYTYRVRLPKDAKPNCPYFVSVLYGPDNEADYSYLGFIRNGVYEHGEKSVLAAADVRERAFEYFWKHVKAGQMPPYMEVWHEGRCCKCNRKLTVPDSIQRGIGPECVKFTNLFQAA